MVQLLTVPLILVETIAVMALGRVASHSPLRKLVPASALMILLGYPGEIAASMGSRARGTPSTIPFRYILYVLFIELTSSLHRQPHEVRTTITRLRGSLLALWCVYPIAYHFPIIGGEFFAPARSHRPLSASGC